MVEGNDATATDEAEQRGGIGGWFSHLPPLSEEKKVKKKREEKRKVGPTFSLTYMWAPHTFFFLTRMPCQRNNISVMLWDLKCTVLYSLGGEIYGIEDKDVKQTRCKVEVWQMNLFLSIFVSAHNSECSMAFEQLH